MKALIFITTLLVMVSRCDTLEPPGKTSEMVSSIDTIEVAAINSSDLDTVYMNAAWRHEGEWRSSELIAVTNTEASTLTIEGISVGEEITFQSFDINKELLLADTTCATGLRYTGDSEIDWTFLCEYPRKFAVRGNRGIYYPWVRFHFTYGCSV